MDWMRDDDNPYFARAIVNRVWAAYFNVGIVEPPDDLSLANPPSNAPLLDHLADGVSLEECEALVDWRATNHFSEAERAALAHADAVVAGEAEFLWQDVVEDAKRGKLFAKLIRQVEVAARSGGGDPETNPTLRTMFQKARDASVPLDTIERAIARATGEPRFVPMVMTDHTSGLIAAQAIGFALFRREKTGKGEAIDVPMLENMASFVSSEHMGAMTFDPPVGPSGDGRLLSPNYKPVPTKDGYVTVRPNTNVQAFAFFDAIGKPELKTDPRFNSAAARTRNAAAYFEVQTTSLGHKTTDEWVELFDKLDVPAARYNTIDELLIDPHLTDVGFFKEEQHPSEGKIKRTRLANTFSGGARSNETPAPLMGQHTREILKEAGFSPAEIDAMVAGGAAISS